MIRWQILGCALLVLFGAYCATATAYADTPSRSSSYELYESVLGGGGLVQENSSHYQAGEFIGDLAVGNATSSNFQVNAGFDTTGDPGLTFAVNSATSFGAFTTTSAATATATFSVVDYTSYGYVVQIIGNPPSYNGHTIPAMASTGPSTPGTEQFGINLVKNSNFCGAGCNVGADPNYGLFAATSAAPTANYNTPNDFRYVSGETIVQSPKSSGIITYTISFIVNVTSLTPGGEYISDQSLICTGTY